MRKFLLLISITFFICAAGQAQVKYKKIELDGSRDDVTSLFKNDKNKSSNVQPLSRARQIQNVLNFTPEEKQCASHDLLLEQIANGERESIEDFENWMTEKQMQQKAAVESKLGTELPTGTVISNNHDGTQKYIIPYVMHVIFDESDGVPNSIGDIHGFNLSTAQLNSQIRVLNEDFTKTNADRANSPHWDAVAADLEIEFVPITYNVKTGEPLAEPGINRLQIEAEGLPAFTPAGIFNQFDYYSTGQLENEVKPATIWDHTKVLNFWVVPLQSGFFGTLFGYAQFPASGLIGIPGSANPMTDGLVITSPTWGSDDYNDGSFLMFGGGTWKGRTATHEIGHGLGLRHNWGDGNCMVDDFVTDTPVQNGPTPFICEVYPNRNTCSNDVDFGSPADLPDMVENFMDYTQDPCMNLFTIGQKERVDIVMGESPGRKELVNDPHVIAGSTATINEGDTTFEDGCDSYTDTYVAFRMWGNSDGKNPTADVVVSGTSTATVGSDFDFIDDSGNVLNPTTISLSFQSDLNISDQIIHLRIYNDLEIEGTETIILDLVNYDDDGSVVKLDPDGSSAQISIDDNDFNVDGSTIAALLLKEDWESGSLGSWGSGLIFGEVANNWTVGENAAKSGAFSAYISNDANGTKPYAYSSNPFGRDYSLLWYSTPFDMDAMESPVLEFDWSGFAEQNYDLGTILFINEGFTSFFISEETYWDSDDINHVSYEIPSPYNTGKWYVGFLFSFDTSVSSDDDGRTSFSVDEIKFFDKRKFTFETSVTGEYSGEFYLGPNTTVNFLSKKGEGEELIATITNSSDHDYGCTKVEIDRAGMASTPFFEISCGADEMMDKTILITPENANPDGAFDVALYYTEDEIAGWEAATGSSRTELIMIHTSSAISTASSDLPLPNSSVVMTEYNNYGSGFKGSFSGESLSGGYGLVPAPSYGVYGLKAEVEDEQVNVTWNSAFNDLNNVDYYIVEESADGVNWKELAIIPATGADSYKVIDYFPEDGGNFYRLTAITKKCDNLVSDNAYVNFETTDVIKLYPNPASDEITVLVSDAEIKDFVQIQIYDEVGKMVLSQDVISRTGVMRYKFDIDGLAAGQYFVRVEGGSKEFKAAPFVKVD